MDLTTLTPEERQAAEQAVAELRNRTVCNVIYFSSAEYLDGMPSPGCIRKGQVDIAYLTEGSEAFAPAMLNGLKLAEASDNDLIKLAIKHDVVYDTAWEREGAVTSPWRENHDFKEEFIAFLNALRSL